jgi:HPt (histidine-containing phosphotransfer) domain-containing protein
MYVGDNADLYRRMLRKFLEAFPGVALEISAHLSAGDRITAQRSAHSIKGTAATLGMNTLSAAAASLEESLRNNLPAEESSARLSLLAQVLDLTLLAVRDRLGDPLPP